MAATSSELSESDGASGSGVDPREGWRPNSEKDRDEWVRGPASRPGIKVDRSLGSQSPNRERVSGVASGVRLRPGRLLRATGADLSWSPYAGKGVVEYQVHRGTTPGFTPSAETLVAPLDPKTRHFSDRSAPPEIKGKGRAYSYRIVVRLADGRLLTSAVLSVRLPLIGHLLDGLSGVVGGVVGGVGGIVGGLLPGDEGQDKPPPLDKDGTYYIPGTPARAIPGERQQVEATITNTTDRVFTAGEWALSYRWMWNGKNVSNPFNQRATKLPKELKPGESVTFKATLQIPWLKNVLASRVEYQLAWDLRDRRTGAWLSKTDQIAPSVHDVVVERPTSNELGLEKFNAYAGKNTGAGSTAMGNLHSGNVVWSYNAFTNPSRGSSAFARLAYNSQDLSSSPAGRGWSLQLSSPLRLGSPLHFFPLNTVPLKVAMTDGDGTTHVFHKDIKKHEWRAPAGVNMRLKQLVKVCLPVLSHEREAWELLRPDRTRFLFDCQGYPTAMIDKNGNRMEFTYNQKLLGVLGKQLEYVTDAEGRRTLDIEYFDKLEKYRWVDHDGAVHEGKLLLNPLLMGKVKSVTDISGRRLDFTYSQKGLLGRVEDGAGSEQPKVFKFDYGATWDLPICKIAKITDPRGHNTELDYVGLHDKKPLRFHGNLKTVTDRLGGTTKYAYDDVDGIHGTFVRTAVTDANNHTTRQLTDGYGRPVELIDAKRQVTKIGWDADNNVTRLEEPNRAVSTWKYDPKTGYPLEIRDAEAVRERAPPTKLTYATGEGGHIAELVGRTTPEGRRWRLDYDRRGNLTSVTDPKGVQTRKPGDYTTRYRYDDHGQLTRTTDANGHTTKYSDYAPVGYPRVATDPLGHRTVTTYDARGNVTELKEANGATTSQSYDTFGRPLENRAPIDQDAGEFAVTPAPVYDANDNTVRFTAPNNAATTSTYDAADQLTATVSPKDRPGDPARKTSLTYDKVGNQLTVTAPKGNLTDDRDDFVTTTRYDERNQPVAVIDAKGGRTTSRYDAVGNLIEVVDPVKNASSAPRDFTSKFAYDLNHRALRTTDAAGKSTTSSYDFDGLTTATTDANGNRTNMLFDARGALVETKVPHRKSGGHVVANTTRYGYDQVGNQTKVTTPRGVRTGNPDDFTAETVYDELNRVKEALTPYDPNDSRYNKPDRTRYSYDEVGNLTKVSAPPSGGQNVRDETRYRYFDNGWTKKSTDAFGIENSYRYNKLGQQIQNTLTSAGGAVKRTIDTAFYPSGTTKSRSDDGVPVGRDVVLVDNSDTNNTASNGRWNTGDARGSYGFNIATHAAGNGDARFAWQLNIPRKGKYEVFTRNPKVNGAASDAPFEIKHGGGRTTKKVDQTQKAGKWRSLGSYQFQENGPHAITLTDKANGTVVADAVRLVRDNSRDTDREKKDFGYRYDANGNQVEVTDHSPGAAVDRYTMSYDGLDQITKAVEHDGKAVRNTTALTYDANGNTLTTRHNLTWSQLEYDPLDRVKKITNADSPTAGDRQVTTLSYTARGEMARQTKPNGNAVTYSYFLDGAIQRQRETKANGTVVADDRLEYTPNGHRSKDTLTLMNADNHGDTINNTYAYTYDPQDRVAKVNKTGDSKATESYTHDSSGNVTAQTIAGATTSFTYDRNRLLRSSAGGASSTYNYDPLGRLDTVSSGGQVAKKQRYDGFDRTASTTSGVGAGKKTESFGYDPFDRTTQERTTGTKTETKKFTYLGITSYSLREETVGKSTRSFQYAPWGQKLTQIKTGDGKPRETTQYTYHPRGDVEALTDRGGNTKTTYGYTAYGKNDTTQFSGADKPGPGGQEPDDPYNSYRFNAQRYDTSSGTYDMGFRNYDPTLNRFLTRDMYGGALADMGLTTDPFTGNRYAFAGGNPISFIEIDGHFSLSDFGHAALDVVGLVPVVGEVADLGNCAWYEGEGKHLDAALSCASAIPVAGYVASAAKGAKYGVKGAKALSKAEKAGKAAKAGRGGQKAARRAKPPAKNPPRKPAPDRKPAPSGKEPHSDGSPPQASPKKAPDEPPGSGATCRVPHSFPGGTRVLMADGSTKPIEQIKTGDQVAATDVETADSRGRQVTEAVTDHDTKHLVKITVDTDGHAGHRTATITSTDGHPYWSPDIGRWVKAKNLDRGQWLKTSSGTWVQITAIKRWTQKATVHNLGVAGVHTYYVLAGPAAVLVHNADCGFDPEFPAIKLDNYRGRFNAWLNKKGFKRLPDDWDAHHAIPQEYREHPELRDFDFDAPSNMRGVPGSRMNSRGANVHQDITNQWKWFGDMNSNPTRAQIEDFAAQIDRGYGAYFWAELK